MSAADIAEGEAEVEPGEKAAGNNTARNHRHFSAACTRRAPIQNGAAESDAHEPAARRSQRGVLYTAPFVRSSSCTG